jgi:hypothetical protein
MLTTLTIRPRRRPDMILTLRHTTRLIAAFTASALSLGFALAPMAAHAAAPVDQSIAACSTAWAAQPGMDSLQDVRLVTIDEGSARSKLTLRARDAVGAKVTTRCVVNAKGEVLTVGSVPVTQLASGGAK